jgi:hypothetical protein
MLPLDAFPSTFLTLKMVFPGLMEWVESPTLPLLDLTVIVRLFAALAPAWCVPEASAAPPVAARPAVAVSSSAVAAAR